MASRSRNSTHPSDDLRSRPGTELGQGGPPRQAIARWLASSVTQPEVAHQDWLDGRPAVLRTGIVFDAVRMRPELVHAAVGSTAADVVPRALADILHGPVICHPAVWFYALVPPHTTEIWRSPLATVRGRGGWLGVPRADRLGTGRGITPHWIVPVERIGRLCEADVVADLLRAGQERLEAVRTGAAVPDSSYQVGYAELLAHASACSVCSDSHAACETGALLRRTVRQARR
ncbi:hypothetical protein GCM10009654_27160 [Streptomyces hebeiensis]|uniref:Uncharacterized protein n=1 Tax=Streptomyces hebeiensis TaxID=229486 RepID=A0ABN1UTX1_9ACTN